MYYAHLRKGGAFKTIKASLENSGNQNVDPLLSVKQSCSSLVLDAISSKSRFLLIFSHSFPTWVPPFFLGAPGVA